LLGTAFLAVTAGLLSAQQPAKAASSTPKAAAPAAAKPAAPVPAPAAKPAAFLPTAASSGDKEEPTSSLIQGDLIYKHLGEADPFWPKPAPNPKDCKPGELGCVGPDAKGCKKYKLEEMILTGVTDTNGLKVAMLTAENKPYFVKAGDQCRDAQVLEVDVKTTCVKWRQVIPQSENNIRPYKDVTSCLKSQVPPR
jgi:hypothetical protein